MIRIPAKTVFIDPAVRRHGNCRERLDRVLPFIDCHDIREARLGDYEAIRAIGHRRHGKDDFADDCMVIFTAFDPARADWCYHFRHGTLADEGGYVCNCGGFSTPGQPCHDRWAKR